MKVIIYAVNGGLIHANPLTGIKANFKKSKKENMAALKPEELPELVAAIANASIKRTTRWSEINLDEKIWTIPAEHMKKRRTHRIAACAPSGSIKLQMCSCCGNPKSMLGKPARSAGTLGMTFANRCGQTPFTLRPFTHINNLIYTC